MARPSLQLYLGILLCTLAIAELARGGKGAANEGAPGPPSRDQVGKEKACVLILCRNSDLDDLRETLATFEDTFNRKYKYPYVFLNDEDFTEDFKRGALSMVSSQAHFGKVPKEHWSYPPHTDQGKAKKKRDEMAAKNVIYGGSESYRHMCRFFSGFFYKHPLTLPYDFYWRVEPTVRFLCPVDYDVFTYMRERKKKYGFVITLQDYGETIPTLWGTVRDFLKSYVPPPGPAPANSPPAAQRVEAARGADENAEILSKIPRDSLLNFISDPNAQAYNACHFWSNFEVGDFSFFRSPIYNEYFAFLDKAGGFFYERWGDAPVHSIAVALFLPKDQVHFFDDVGYMHPPFTHCPSDVERRPLCKCQRKDSVENTVPYCMAMYKMQQNSPPVK